MKIVTTTVGVDSLIEAATRTDDIAPLSEQFLLSLDSTDHQHFVALDPEPVGLIASDGLTAELVVHPDYRRRKIATQLVAQFDQIPLWAHGNLPAAQGFAESLGKKPVRELLVMATAAANFHPDWPIAVRQLNLDQAREEFGAQYVDAQWLKTNNEAFSWHPEQGGWDQNRLDKSRDTDWFLPQDFLTFWEDDQMVGFHWTKRHGDLSQGADGEVYVVGLADSGRGRGLGGPLVAAGLEHLQNQGAQRIFLYVEADNAAAVKAYEKLGFETVESHVLYG
jgi:hypothetical protein